MERGRSLGQIFKVHSQAVAEASSGDGAGEGGSKEDFAGGGVLKSLKQNQGKRTVFLKPLRHKILMKKSAKGKNAETLAIKGFF